MFSALRIRPNTARPQPCPNATILRCFPRHPFYIKVNESVIGGVARRPFTNLREIMQMKVLVPVKRVIDYNVKVREGGRKRCRSC